jgi:3-dehydroquinate dehydratase
MIAVTIPGPTRADVESQLRNALSADLVELRFDLWQEFFLPDLPLPAIFTFRHLPYRDLPIQPAYVDLEWGKTDPGLLREQSSRLLLSYHNHSSWQDPKPLLAQMKQTPAALYKIALTPRSSLDLFPLLQANIDIPIALGPLGQSARILALPFGARLTYAAADSSSALYSQIPLSLLLDLYQIKKKRPLYALLGDPVDHSIGHLFHNPDRLYIKLRLTAEELAPFFALSLPFTGFSITSPLKTAILPFVQTDWPAVNTLKRTSTGYLATNTDAPAALDLFGPIQSLAILGTGAVATSLLHLAKQRSIASYVYSTNSERAAQMNRLLSPLDSYDALINTTPKPPLPLPSAKQALDILYPSHPLRPHFHGPCFTGHDLFYAQARLQKIFWDS